MISSDGIPAAHAALARFLFGSAGLLGIMLFNRPWPKLTRETSWKLAAMGFVGVFLYNVCFFTGLATVPSGRASLMASLQPAAVYLFSSIVWREHPSRIKIAGLIVSFLGALLVLSQGDLDRLFRSGLNTGDLWILGCVFSWVSYTLIGRTMTGRLPAGPTTAYSTWFGTALLVPLALAAPPALHPWGWRDWSASAFLGLGGTTVAFLLYLKGLGAIGASRASIFINLVPVFGVLFSVVLLGERLSGASILGGILVIAGVRLLNR